MTKPLNLFQQSRTELSASQCVALRNLEAKSRGEDVDWISIANARSLTDLGLAERNGAGWNITSTGKAWLERAAQATPAREDDSAGEAPNPALPG